VLDRTERFPLVVGEAAQHAVDAELKVREFSEFRKEVHRDSPVEAI
jgi:hypothetical protein